MEPRIQFAKTEDGVSIAYATLGHGQPLVCLPPWPVDAELTWESSEARELFSALAKRHRLAIPTRRGVGASQGSIHELSLETHLADLDAVVDHLELDRFDLFGCVDGASISAAYAASHPARVTKLVLWAPYAQGIGSDRPGQRSLVNLVREHWSLGRKAIADVVFPSGPLEAQDWFADYLRRSMSKDVAAKYLDFQADLDVREYLAHIIAPTLVLYRRNDRNLPPRVARAAAALIPDARIVPLDGDIGHPFFGDTSYARIVSRFLHDEPDAPAAPDSSAIHTILFTDMESSTALTQRLGDAKAQELVRAHNAIVREALSAHEGSEIKHTGDGIMASFPSASSALECAIAIQRAIGKREEETPLAVRIGLNTGEPIAEDKDLFGTAVQLARRICDQAAPDEILVSNVVRELVAGKGFLFSDRGEVVPKGFDEAVRLYEVQWREDAGQS